MKNNKKSHTLKRFLFNYFRVLLGILALSMILGFMILSDYEKNLPSAPGNQIIKALESSDTQSLDKFSSNFPASLRKPEFFKAYMATFGAEPNLYFYEGTSKIENQLIYIIANHDKKIATLTLEKTGKKSTFGFQQVKVLDLIFKPLHEYKISVINDVDVLINGVSIKEQTQELKQETIPAFDLDAFNHLKSSTYTFKDFQFISTVTVPDHPEVEVLFDPLTSTYKIVSKADQSTQAAIAKFSEAAIKAHTRLLSIPSNSRNTFLTDYAYVGSHFESNVKLYDLTVRYPFISDSFEGLVTDNLVNYGPHAYSVDVSINYTWTSTWVGVIKTKTSHPSVTLYLTDLNGRWQILDMVLKRTH